MFTKVEVRSDQGALLTLPLTDISEGYVIEDIEGLDPVKANLVSSGFAGLDGEQYQAARREKRNLVLKLKLEPDYALTTVKSLRDGLYDFFMPKAQVHLRFFLVGGLTVDISARVEDFDCPLFVREPKATITMLAFNPDFVDINEVLVSGNTTDTTTESDIVYPGTVETGFIFTLMVNRPIEEFSIYHRPPDNTLRSFDFSGSLVAGNELEISTVSRAKGVTLVGGGSFLQGVSPLSNWITLHRGVNKLRVFAEGAPIPYNIRYTARYGGL